MSTTLVEYEQELWMCNLTQQPYMLYKSWSDFKSGTNGLVAKEVSTFWFSRNDTTAPAGIPSTEVVMWSEGRLPYQLSDIPTVLRVRPVAYRLNKRTHAWEFDDTRECYNESDRQDAWPQIKAYIQQCAPDSSFSEGPNVLLGYFEGYRRPNHTEVEYLNGPFNWWGPRLSFGGMHGRGLSFSYNETRPPDYIQVLRWVAWMNTLQLYPDPKLEPTWLASRVVYAPHSIVLPSTKMVRRSPGHFELPL